jgi:hypothetical protein
LRKFPVKSLHNRELDCVVRAQFSLIVLTEMKLALRPVID